MPIRLSSIWIPDQLRRLKRTIECHIFRSNSICRHALLICDQAWTGRSHDIPPFTPRQHLGSFLIARGKYSRYLWMMNETTSITNFSLIEKLAQGRVDRGFRWHTYLYRGAPFSLFFFFFFLCSALFYQKLDSLHHSSWRLFFSCTVWEAAGYIKHIGICNVLCCSLFPLFNLRLCSHLLMLYGGFESHTLEKLQLHTCQICP
ncbi:hypothetical protein QBC35DRAFT_253279 [Podospora australis]|uniref:Uncharacterized protein n=1 Tax=Podospora australis TaxID=1536484 RepID=A0AAN6WUR9_9PEZI|nr:hypothetical protein QBC35DRAFT_253279 [Podospora australis]